MGIGNFYSIMKKYCYCTLLGCTLRCVVTGQYSNRTLPDHGKIPKKNWKTGKFWGIMTTDIIDFPYKSKECGNNTEG